MRLIHGIAAMLARMLFGREAEDSAEVTSVLPEEAREHHDYLRRLVDEGKINEAEDRLFELIESTAWEDRQKAALIIGFYDYVNSRDDEFLAEADFSREEIIRGLEDAMKTVHMEIPEYLRISRSGW
jgi:hypothetical protein